MSKVVESGAKWKMFFGTYEHNLDEKGRLVIPSKLREQLSPVCYLMKGYDGTLAIFKASDFEKIVERCMSMDLDSLNQRNYLRSQLPTAVQMEIDKQGRLQIPTILINKYHLEKELVILGMGDRLEIWNKKAYINYENESLNDFGAIAEQVGKEKKNG